MNLLQILSLVNDVRKVLEELQHDGVLKELIEAIEAVQAALAKPEVRELLEKVAHLFHKE